jgi:hypothetical protein
LTSSLETSTVTPASAVSSDQFVSCLADTAIWLLKLIRIIKFHLDFLADRLLVLLNMVMAAHLVLEGIKPDTSNTPASILNSALDTGRIQSFKPFVK